MKGGADAKSKAMPHKRGSGDAKRLKFHSKTCKSSPTETLIFKKLDPSIPEQKRRLEQRRKMISYGKNTAGYEEYLKKVPKEKRKKRSMETPMTPDYTLDIPNKRWVGQVRAWRRALHNYDPADLQASLASVAEPMDTANTAAETPDPNFSVQDKQLADAKKNGLLVDLGDTTNNVSPTSVLGFARNEQAEMKELDQWDSARNDFDLDDSDDELL